MIDLSKTQVTLDIKHPRNKQAFVRTPVPDEHLKHLISYFSDPALEEVMGWKLSSTSKDTEHLIQEISDCCHPNCQSEQYLIFGEYLSPDTMPIGYHVIKGINLELAVAEYGHATLDPLHRSRGYGRLAMRTILRHAFDNLGIEKIYGFVLVSNKAEITMTKKVGWQLVETTPWQMPDGTNEPMDTIEIAIDNLIA